MTDVKVGDMVTVEVPEGWRTHLPADELSAHPWEVLLVEAGTRLFDSDVLVVDRGESGTRLLSEWCTVVAEAEPPPLPCQCPSLAFLQTGHLAGCPHRPALSWSERAARGLV